MRHNLIKARKKAGLTQGDVSEAIGVSRAWYVAVEGGGVDPRTGQMESIADVLGVEEAERRDLIKDE